MKSKFIKDSIKFRRDNNEHSTQNVIQTDIWVQTNVTNGYQKVQHNSYLRLKDNHTIEGYNEENNVERKYQMDYIFTKENNNAEIFKTSIKRLINSAFEKGYQHSLIFFNPNSLRKSLELLGLVQTKEPTETALMYHTIKYIMDLSTMKSDLQTPLQIAMVAYQDEKIIDLYNDGKPLEAPLGYTIEKPDQIKKFFRHSKDLLKNFSGITHLCISLYFQNRKIINRDEVEEIDACVNFILLKGEDMIDLARFLTKEKDQVDDTTPLNHIEKLLLHFITSNYDAENLPYSEWPITDFFRKYLPFSRRKDILFYLDFDNKNLDKLTNDLLYIELCKEVAEVPDKEDDEDDTVLGSRILKDLTDNRYIIENEYEDLKQQKNLLEESILKLESVSTDRISKANNVQRIVLNTQYEKFLNEMNFKMKNLVHASSELLYGMNNMLDELPKQKATPRFMSMHKSGDQKNSNHNLYQNSEQNIQHNDFGFSKPLEIINLNNSRGTNTTKDKVGVLAQIDMLQEELRLNLDYFVQNFGHLKDEIKNTKRSESTKSEWERTAEKLKDIAHKSMNNISRSISKTKDKKVDTSRVLATLSDSKVYQRQKSEKKNNNDKSRSNMYIVPGDKPEFDYEDFKDMFSKDKKHLFTGKASFTEIEKYKSRSPTSPKKLLKSDSKQIDFKSAITGKKLLEFSLKNVTSVFNEILFSMTEVELIDELSKPLCGVQKSKPRVKPLNSKEQEEQKTKIHTTIEDFRTTYERYETEMLITENDSSRIVKKSPRMHPTNSDIKAVDNKQSFSITFSQDPSQFRASIAPSEGGKGTPNAAKKSLIFQSILQKLEALDDEDKKDGIVVNKNLKY